MTFSKMRAVENAVNKNKRPRHYRQSRIAYFPVAEMSAEDQHSFSFLTGFGVIIQTFNADPIGVNYLCLNTEYRQNPLQQL